VKIVSVPGGKRTVRAAKAGVGLAAVAAAQIVGGGVAHADANASYYNAFPNDFYVHALWGNSLYWNNSQMRRWNIQTFGPLVLPRNTCNYNARFFGVGADGAQYSSSGSYHAGCSAAGPAWVDSVPVGWQMRNNSWACGEWKEDNTWSGKYTCVLLTA
jgi:hypothetical protein